MVAIFINKYVVYKLDNESNSSCLIPENIYYYKIIDGIIYENFIFIFLTDKGFYYHILTEQDTYPNKFLKFSDLLNQYHIKISKKLKDKSNTYTKTLSPLKILGVFDNNLTYTNSFNEVYIKEIEHPLFTIIQMIKKKKLSAVSLLLNVLEKKYIKSFVAITKYYFDNNEDIMRKIFPNIDLILHFDLHEHLDFFLEDLLKCPATGEKADKILRKALVKALAEKYEEKIKKLYDFANQNKL
jgi:hypothetical protein